uniref:Uncharacterized protein n=1 Tax=Heliothis virescens TaxID=7102 RepID=A0A2A4K8U6_HELVI
MVNARVEAISRRLPAEILRPPLAADTRRRAEEPPRPAPRKGKPAEGRKPEVERIVRLQCGSMVNARVEAISRRLRAEILRPPLAGDTRRRAEEPPRPAPRKGKPAEGRKPVEGAPSGDQSTTAGSKGETWATVVGRKKARKAAKKAAAAARAPVASAKVAQPARRTAKSSRKGPAAISPRLPGLRVRPGQQSWAARRLQLQRAPRCECKGGPACATDCQEPQTTGYLGSSEEDALYEVYRASKETLWLAIGDSSRVPGRSCWGR